MLRSLIQKSTSAVLALVLVAGAYLFVAPPRASAVTCGFGTDNGSGICVGFLTTAAASPWSVPSDWNNVNNTVEVIGGGGGGGASTAGGGGGGGGAYSKVTNINLGTQTTASFGVGTGGTTEVAGGDTWFNATSFAGCTTAATCVSAAGGAAGTNATAGTGGTTGVGTVAAGGNGGAGSAVGTDSSGGGGGAGGPGGAGKDGGGGDTNSAGQEASGGGGGAGGGSSTAGTGGGADGGNGGDGPAGTGHGTGGVTAAGTAGSAGGGGGGGDQGFSGGAGGSGTEWDATHGAGGGGGGAGSTAGNVGGNGGAFGGGGGGVDLATGGGTGGAGLIVISYTPNVAPSAPTLDSPADGTTGVSITPTFLMTSTDVDGDNVAYKVTLYSDSCSTVVQTHDETLSSAGWTGQNATCTNNPTSCYASGTQGNFTIQSADTLAYSTTYHWDAVATDPDGSGGFATSSCHSFTTGTTSFTQNYYRWYADNNALLPTDPWPAGATDLGENTEITAADSPIISGGAIRLRMSVQAGTQNETANSQAFKLQYGARSTSCSAVTSWSDAGDAASTTALWRGVNDAPADDTALSGNPPTTGDLVLSVSDRAGTYEEQGTTTPNPFAAAVGEDTEYDFALQDHGAADATSYCFRLVKSNTTTLDAYNFYPTVKTIGYQPESRNWRWYDDESDETPVTPLAAENAAPSTIAPTASNGVLKLRMTIADTQGIAGSNVKFKIQFSTDPSFATGVTDVAATTTCAVASRWCYGDGVDQDNDLITTRVLTDSAANGTHNEGGTSASTFDPPASTATEFEFTLHDSGAFSSTVYFFRAFDVTDGIPVALGSGKSYPSVSTAGGTLTVAVQGLDSGTTTEGVTTTSTSTATSVAFGALAIGTPLTSAQRMVVTTNATEGYQTSVYENQDLTNDTGNTIPPVAGTNAAPSAWSVGCTATSSGCLGYHSGDDTLANGSTRFAANDTFAGFTTAPSEVAFSSGPVASDTVDLVFKIQIGQTQQPGSYENNIGYIVTPVF